MRADSEPSLLSSLCCRPTAHSSFHHPPTICTLRMHPPFCSRTASGSPVHTYNTRLLRGTTPNSSSYRRKKYYKIVIMFTANYLPYLAHHLLLLIGRDEIHPYI
jgi:hypothetical protein